MHKTLSKRFTLFLLLCQCTYLCATSTRVEFIQISKAVAIGFAVMGFIGYLVKLIHIPM
ncbi:hypothetical protein DFH94DRAFT_734494 [Russula ochroleuca]|uniref:Uncharacterized protein n=1 Tax=Russula ochroleuca TaxID=152965 RepID=A0A9P5TAC7_9AGAM|nr:hypothetical protein DFH94DRAFT_789996 [Russula ochroleuca]KAF8482003.1 hypothetical protein DFH94DRAFT_734494 [Russula ochroleuca]